MFVQYTMSPDKIDILLPMMLRAGYWRKRKLVQKTALPSQNYELEIGPRYPK
jgi:hypothetical protein